MTDTAVSQAVKEVELLVSAEGCGVVIDRNVLLRALLRFYEDKVYAFLTSKDLFVRLSYHRDR